MTKPKTDHQIEIPGNLLKELLTESEWRMVKQRMKIINLIDEGKSIRVIAGEVNVGTDTVVRISKMIKQNESIKKYLIDKKKQLSKWVFGQVSHKEEY